MMAGFIQKISYWPIYLFLKIFFKYQVEGQENLKGLEEGPIIFASNHASFIDGPICGVAMPRSGLTPQKFFPIRFLASETYYYLKNNPFPFPLNLFTTFYIRLNGSIPVIKTGGNLEVALAEPIRLLKEKKIKLWIYPEGRVTRDGNLQSGKRGVAYLHFKTNAPIVPVGLIGTFKILSPKNLLKPKKVKVRIGKPIYSLGNVSLEEGAEKVMAEIAKLLY